VRFNFPRTLLRHLSNSEVTTRLPEGSRQDCYEDRE
jgi:hypothetical protein